MQKFATIVCFCFGLAVLTTFSGCANKRGCAGGSCGAGACSDGSCGLPTSHSATPSFSPTTTAAPTFQGSGSR